MIEITIKDWLKGFVALDLINFIRSKGYGLVESKLMVEKLLERKEIVIRFEDDNNLDEILSMPIICEIRR